MKKIFILVIAIIVTACSGNSSYFDLEKKGIISCNNSDISTVMIKEIDGNFDFYYFKLKDSRKAVKFFSVTEINDAFLITTTSNEIIEQSKFKLKPLSKYEVTNISNGDAAQSTIIVTTDEGGNIITADKTNCK